MPTQLGVNFYKTVDDSKFAFHCNSLFNSADSIIFQFFFRRRRHRRRLLFGIRREFIYSTGIAYAYRTCLVPYTLPTCILFAFRYNIHSKRNASLKAYCWSGARGVDWYSSARFRFFISMCFRSSATGNITPFQWHSKYTKIWMPADTVSSIPVTKRLYSVERWKKKKKKHDDTICATRNTYENV